MRNCLLGSIFFFSMLAACASPNETDGDEVDSTEEAVTGGKVTTARPEIGLVHMEDVNGLWGDLGWATGTVVVRRDVVITAARVIGSGRGTFTVTRNGVSTTHTVVDAVKVEGSKLALLRITPPVDARIAPAEIALPSDRSARSTFYGYGYRNHVCVPMTGSDGKKSFVTRRYRSFGGLFTGPLGVGYTCEADLGGPIALGEEMGSGPILAVNVDSGIDGFEEPGRFRSAIERVVARWR